MKRILSLLFITILLVGSAMAQSGDLSGLRLKLDDGDATPASNNYITLITPATGSLTANYSLTLPVNDGDANQVLTTDGAGVLTWTTPSSSSQWLLAGNTLGSASWNGTTGNRLGTNSAHALVLATTNATPQNILFYTGVSGADERMRINGTDGRVGINETSPESQLHVVSNSTDNGNDLIIEGFNNGSATDGAEIRTRRGRGTYDSPSNVQDGDDLGGFKFEGYYQGAFREAAQIDINVVEAPVNDADDNLLVEMGFNLDDGDGNKNRIVTMVPTERVGILTSNPNTKLDINGDYATRYTSLSLSNGANNNINPGAYSYVRITGPTANFNITGMRTGANGKRITLYNTTSYTMDFKHESASSVDTTRFYNPVASDVTIYAGGSASFIYDAVQDRWILTSLTNGFVPQIASQILRRKSADESVTNSSTMQDDDHLQWPVTAGQIWEVRGIAYFTSSSSSPNFKFQFEMPGGAGDDLDVFFKTYRIGTTGGGIERAGQLTSPSTSSGVCNITGGVDYVLEVNGVFQVGASSGDIIFQWAQNSSNGTATIVKDNSYFFITRIQ